MREPRVATLAFDPLRRVSSRTGEVGALLSFLLVCGLSGPMIVSSSACMRSLGVAGLLSIILAAYGRLGRNRADRALACEFARISAPTQVDIECERWLGVQRGASQQEIRRAARDVMISGHPDKGGSGVDMGLVTQVRDHLVQRSQEVAQELDAAPLLDLWQRRAGFVGRLWAAILPSEAMSILSDETGRHPMDMRASNEPRPLGRAAGNRDGVRTPKGA